jgi:hypothetical protein
MQKKSRNSRGKSRAMETHFYPIHFFFLSLVFSYEHAERFPAFFLCLLSISRIMNAKKKTRNSRGKSRAMETHFYPIHFFFSFTRLFLWALRKIPYYFFRCAVSICTVLKAKKSPNEQYFLGFSGNSQILVIDTKFSRAPNFNVHQIIACPLHHFIATPLPKRDNLERAIIWNAIIWYTR